MTMTYDMTLAAYRYRPLMRIPITPDSHSSRRRLLAVTALFLSALAACNGSLTDPSTGWVTVTPTTVRAVPVVQYGVSGLHFSVDATVTNGGTGPIYLDSNFCGPPLDKLEGDVWVKVELGWVCTLELRSPREIPAGTAIQLHEDVFAPDTAPAYVRYAILTGAMVAGQYRAHYYLLNTDRSELPESAEVSHPFTVFR